MISAVADDPCFQINSTLIDQGSLDPDKPVLQYLVIAPLEAVGGEFHLTPLLRKTDIPSGN